MKELGKKFTAIRNIPDEVKIDKKLRLDEIIHSYKFFTAADIRNKRYAI